VSFYGNIVVGYDGSLSSADATRWAATEAEMCGAPLCVITCYSSAVAVDWSYGSGAITYDVDDVRRAAVESSATIIDRLRAAHPTLSCTARVVSGPPREALVEASEGAELVVVGRTGAGTVKRLIVGSVAQAVVRHSRAPVVIVPRSAANRPAPGAVVVGVDGSPAAGAALAWAVGEASRRRSELVVVHAWTFSSDGPAIEFDRRRSAALADARVLLNRMLISAAGGGGNCIIRGRVVEGSAAAALLKEACSADLLVVGSRGRGGVRSVLFGSVAHAMTEHAPCPTVVVHRPVTLADAEAS
jgi:nucleotide-binding universal stress UspA family protein